MPKPNKVLFCATIDRHLQAFHLPYLRWFKEQNWEVHVAAGGSTNLSFVDKKYNIPFVRAPLHKGNLQAYRLLKAVIADNDYQLIHCHTPVGGALARLAARRARKTGTKVIYTAHGFHFCRGAPLRNWVVYYPIEKMMAHWTDCLITINQEDHAFAVRRNFRAGQIVHVHGVGVNMERFKPFSGLERACARQMLGYREDEILFFYAAEFNENKNQQLLIQALALMKQSAPAARLLLAGDGPLQQHCRELAAGHGLADRVDFLGYRDDIAMLLPVCDIAVAASIREGLPVNILEAMACGLPIVATHNRGHNELVGDGVNGYLVAPDRPDLFANRLLELYCGSEQRKWMGFESRQRVKLYAIDRVEEELQDVYSRYSGGDAYESEGQHNRAYL